MRENISSGSPWEDIVGYSRAVRVGNVVEVAGTTAMDGDTLIGKGDMYQQTVFVIQNIKDPPRLDKNCECESETCCSSYLK